MSKYDLNWYKETKHKYDYALTVAARAVNNEKLKETLTDIQANLRSGVLRLDRKRAILQSDNGGEG